MPTPMPMAAVVFNPVPAFPMLEGEEVALGEIDGLDVPQHGTHILLEQTQSLSQSFSFVHLSPRQWPNHVHLAVEVALGAELVWRAWKRGELVMLDIGIRYQARVLGCCSNEVSPWTSSG